MALNHKKTASLIFFWGGGGRGVQIQTAPIFSSTQKTKKFIGKECLRFMLPSLKWRHLPQPPQCLVIKLPNLHRNLILKWLHLTWVRCGFSITMYRPKSDQVISVNRSCDKKVDCFNFF